MRTIAPTADEVVDDHHARPTVAIQKGAGQGQRDHRRKQDAKVTMPVSTGEP